jgi:hypothetical protein
MVSSSFSTVAPAGFLLMYLVIYSPTIPWVPPWSGPSAVQQLICRDQIMAVTVTL